MSILPMPVYLAMPACAEVPRVVTDIPPIHALTAQVMGDLGRPVLLLAKGADEHDFQLRPSQMGHIAAADLIVWVGPELTPWLERVLVQGGGARSLALLDESGTQVINYAQNGGINPHAWMEPANAALWLDLIAAALSDLDPEHGTIFAANAAAAKTKIAAMDAEIAAELAPVLAKGFVTYHDAYGYFTAHYGLNFVGAMALGDAATAGAAHVRELQGKIAAAPVCVFPENQHDGALLVQLMDGTDARLGAALDPVGSTLPPGEGAYEALMRAIGKNLLDCLSGA